MEDTKIDCEKLLIHIKKCKSAMSWDGYTDAGIAGYFLKLPFRKIHRKHFKEIEMYTEKLRVYIEENNIDIELEVFEEYENSSILYSSGQLASLACKQYEHRIKYLDNLKGKVNLLISYIDR